MSKLLAGLFFAYLMCSAPAAIAAPADAPTANFNRAGTLLYMSDPVYTETVTVFQTSTALNAMVAIQLTGSVYRMEIAVLPTSSVTISSTGYLRASWTGSLTGGMTSADGVNPDYNLLHFTPFGLKDGDRDRAGFKEHVDPMLARRAWPVLYVANPELQSKMPSELPKVIVRYWTLPSGPPIVRP